METNEPDQYRTRTDLNVTTKKGTWIFSSPSRPAIRYLGPLTSALVTSNQIFPPILFYIRLFTRIFHFRCVDSNACHRATRDERIVRWWGVRVGASRSSEEFYPRAVVVVHDSPGCSELNYSRHRWYMQTRNRVRRWNKTGNEQRDSGTKSEEYRLL